MLDQLATGFVTTRESMRPGDRMRLLELEMQARSVAPAVVEPVAIPDHRTLPTWPDSMAGIPNLLLRTALFAAVQSKSRRTMLRELVGSLEGTEVRFTGIQLDQSDLDVLEILVHLARRQPMSSLVHVSANEILKSMGRDEGGEQHNWLKNAIARLYSGGIEITHQGKNTFFGNLFKGFRDEETQHYVIQFDSALLALYDTGWTQVDRSIRQALRRKPLALWLHGWYSSHASPYPLKVTTLYQLSGSKNPQLSSFRRQLREALDALLELGFVGAWKIEKSSDTVHVTRSGTATQQRHLQKKAIKKEVARRKQLA
ncbi:plasmid replication initiator TrfA [Pollutimonas sp. H1-120]|uniref:plasmid replication initiator TrfA n=1 Tax=Pollutimonas sp. H1-120 TaxID=3148824 RepID=UPI003B52599C